MTLNILLDCNSFDFIEENIEKIKRTNLDY